MNVRANALRTTAIGVLLLGAGQVPASDCAPEGWTVAVSRDEVRPDFRYEDAGGRDGKGRFVIEHDRSVVADYLRGGRARVPAEHPTDKATDGDGWTEVSDTYLAPDGATQAVIKFPRHRP